MSPFGAIASHYVAGGGGPPASWNAAITALSPYAWYKMDEASGTTLVDATGSANGVTAASNITHNQASMIPSDATGKSKITASGGQIDSGVIGKDSVTGFTMIWTYKGTTSNVVGNGEIFRTLGAGVTVRVGASDITLTQWGTSTPGSSLGARSALLTGSAVLVCLVCLAGDQRLYINATLNGSAAITVGTDPTGTDTFRFARNTAANFLSGQYDDLVFVPGALTGGQVSSLYSSWLGV